MPDTGNYLIDGVMSGNPLGIELPDEIVREMEEAALDAADEIIDAHRRVNRAFDIACDPDALAWTFWEYPGVQSLHVGMHVSVSFEGRPDEHLVHGKIASGTITSIGDHYLSIDTDQGAASMPVLIEKITRISARVPVPLDASTLGKYPEEKAYEEV